ncbi:MAG: helix-turn-helix domain-containing protein [Cyclobacteriaceae bacterium]
MGKHKVKSRNLKKLKVLGTHIRQIRPGKNLTQEQLADLAGVSENTIVTLESGKLNTTVEPLANNPTLLWSLPAIPWPRILPTLVGVTSSKSEIFIK